jgi:hypothetical protein
MAKMLGLAGLSKIMKKIAKLTEQQDGFVHLISR